jgi:ppGpp synthetase/RelA/SpoT-type nucleotidyltranferase
MSSGVVSTEIGYVEFGEWYDSYRARVLEPALAVADASLERALTELLSDRDLARIRSTSGRVKSKRRTWRKICHPRYRGQISSLDDIADAIDDLVGLRVTCINVRDIDMIQTALDALPRTPTSGLWLDPASERDYVAEPKESGYRGWHVNLGVEVGEIPVICELQVRTLLQDSWGELTHEETYSKDGALPPLVDVLSTRMADLLSILDDIAEDLRTELDRIDQEVVAEPDDSLMVAADALAGQAADAAALLRARWASMTRPTDLAGLAWALQREFGAEISDGWFGHGSFKRFLRHAVPEGEISSGRQGYLLPIDSSVSGDGNNNDGNDSQESAFRPPHSKGEPSVEESVLGSAPGSARQLRRIDREFPLLPEADWQVLFEHLAESWRRVKPVDANVSTVNRLTRSARDLARGAGTALSRRTLDCVVKGLLALDETRRVETPLSGPVLADLFAGQTVQRMVELRILNDAESKIAASVERWIAGPIE